MKRLHLVRLMNQNQMKRNSNKIEIGRNSNLNKSNPLKDQFTIKWNEKKKEFYNF